MLNAKSIHPAVQIILWGVLVAVMQRLTLIPLLLMSAVLLTLGAYLSGSKLLQLLRRTRWIMLSLMLIYAYSTPGTPFIESLGSWGPIREGLLDGVMQLLRLLSALASLAILLDHLHRQALISGLYSLFAPLVWLGMSRERCAIRLALTLHYAEVAMLRSHARWQDTLQELQAFPVNAPHPIELPIYRLGYIDVFLSGLCLIMVMGLILK